MDTPVRRVPSPQLVAALTRANQVAGTAPHRLSQRPAPPLSLVRARQSTVQLASSGNRCVGASNLASMNHVLWAGRPPVAA